MIYRSSDQEEMINGETVWVWLGDDLSHLDGPYRGEVIKARKQWVQLHDYPVRGFIADEGQIYQWTRDEKDLPT